MQGGAYVNFVSVRNTCLFAPAPYYKLNKGFFLGFLFKPLGKHGKSILYLLLRSMKLEEVNTRILTLVMLDVYMCYTLHQFRSNSYSNYKHVFTSKAKTVYIKISWILRSQLTLFFTVSKQDISRV